MKNVKTIKAYKLFRTLKSHPGKIFPLFIDKSNPVPIGEWVTAKTIPTKGYALRPGWHCSTLPSAPHLLKKDGTMAEERIWAEVEIPVDSYYNFKRPTKQGIEWKIAEVIKVIKLLTSEEVKECLQV